ncbi:MAG: DNA (cytosine-5-)-methyltransferase [Flavobacteriales bacterium]|nr:DNA (cytosine-5-)-methyltransferase [Flavobacteriales bacterium]
MKKPDKKDKRKAPLKRTGKLVRKVKLKTTATPERKAKGKASVAHEPLPHYGPKSTPAINGSHRFIDLFCGIGGFHRAFEKQGGHCVFASDWDKYSQKTYAANFPQTKLIGDITVVPVEDIPEHDVLCAGFPCQPFSLAGVSKKNSLGRKHGFEDERQGNLFFNIAAILDHHRPAAFVLENVKNLKSHDKGRTFKTIHEILTKDLGYHVYYRVIDAQSVVPQHRERIFIVGFREPRFFEWPVFPKEGPKLGEILDTKVEDKYTLTDNLWAYLQNYARKHREAGNGFGFGMTNSKGIARTLSARYHKDGSEILIDQGRSKNPRRLTPRECARLMGYPESHKIIVSDTQEYRQFGNSVVVPVVERVAKAVVAALHEPVLDEEPLVMEFGEPKPEDGGRALKVTSTSAKVVKRKRPATI